MLGTSFALGAPDDHKKEFWYRWLLYIVRRLLNEEVASIPVTNLLTIESIVKRPAPVTNTVRQVLYPLYGLGDIGEKVKNGKHRGENKYWYYTKKYTLPFFKDIEQMEKFDTDDSIFTVIDISPSGY